MEAQDIIADADDQSFIQIEFKSSEGESAGPSTMVPQTFSVAKLEELLNITLENVFFSIHTPVFTITLFIFFAIRKKKFHIPFG